MSKMVYVLIAAVIAVIAGVYYFVIRPKTIVAAPTTPAENAVIGLADPAKYSIMPIVGSDAPAVPAIIAATAPYAGEAVTPMGLSIAYKGETVTLDNINGSLIPVAQANNSKAVSTDIMQAQIDALKSVWEAAPYVAPVGRNITEAQLRAGDVRAGDIMTVKAAQYGTIMPSYLWYNAPIDAPMVYSGDAWYLGLPYNSESSTPALEFAARNWITGGG